MVCSQLLTSFLRTEYHACSIGGYKLELEQLDGIFVVLDPCVWTNSCCLQIQQVACHQRRWELSIILFSIVELVSGGSLAASQEASEPRRLLPGKHQVKCVTCA